VIVTIGAFWPAIRHVMGQCAHGSFELTPLVEHQPPSPILTELQNRIGAFVLALAAAVFLVGILAYDVGSYEAQHDERLSCSRCPGS